MRFLLIFIISSFWFRAGAQWQDSFADGDYTVNPGWAGDDHDFVVNNGGQLQLNASLAGSSFLAVASTATSLDNKEWHFFIRLNFSPSSSNFARVYLVSDQQNLEGPLNGYYLQFGEGLANDAVELFRQDGNITSSICRATDGQIASSFSLGVKVTRDDIGLWKISVDPAGGTNYTEEAYGAEGLYPTSSYAGVVCTYTSSNRTQFYFDDFYFGPIIYDTIPPTIESCIPVSDHSLQLKFSEALDANSANTIANYELDHSVGIPLTAVIDLTDPKYVTLDFSASFLSGENMQLSISGIKDLSGNQVQSGTTTEFTWYAPVQISKGDVVFSEILFEPLADGPLPDAEFVEIYNRSDKMIPVNNWSLSDGSTTANFPDMRLSPGSYLIVCKNSDTSLFKGYGLVCGTSSFPGLNNDVGDHLVLSDSSGLTIDEVTFSDQSYHDHTKSGGGWSLERIDNSFLCPAEKDWSASISSTHGTPGKINSIHGTYEDHSSPFIRYCHLQDSLHLLVVFSEQLDTSGLSTNGNYQLNFPGDEVHLPLSVSVNDPPLSVVLALPTAFSNGIGSLQVSSSIHDCPGNAMMDYHPGYFAKTVSADSGDVVINELLFHPAEGNSDFIELVNRSGKVFDLNELFVEEMEFENPLSIISSKLISAEHIPFFPNQYILLCENMDGLSARYRVHNPFSLLIADYLPDWNSTEGVAAIQNKNGKILDRFSYRESMHFPLLQITEGISLERLSLNRASSDSNNWHSASQTAGFATPGYENSQRVETGISGGDIQVYPEVISPDEDGKDDLLDIHFQFSDPGKVANVIIYDENGKQIRHLVRNEWIGNEGDFTWDGVNDFRERALRGIYIVWFEVFDEKGNVAHFKKAFGLV